MGGFPISAWLVMTVPPILMILSVLIFYRKEAKREKLEDELLRGDTDSRD